jgi:hypothetical protein
LQIWQTRKFILDLIASKRLSFHPLHFALLSNRLSAIVRIAVKTTVPDNANATFEAGTTALLLEMFSFEPFLEYLYMFIQVGSPALDQK